MRYTALALTLCLTAGCSDDFVVTGPVAPSGEPQILELGKRLVDDLFALDLEGVSQADRDLIYRGSYLVNGASGCTGCHGGPAGYLAGGNEFNLSFLPPDVQGRTSVLARNLTPAPETGMS